MGQHEMDGGQEGLPLIVAAGNDAFHLGALARMIALRGHFGSR